MCLTIRPVDVLWSQELAMFVWNSAGISLQISALSWSIIPQNFLLLLSKGERSLFSSRVRTLHGNVTFGTLVNAIGWERREVTTFCRIMGPATGGEVRGKSAGLSDTSWHRSRGHVPSWVIRNVEMVQLLKSKLNDLFWFLFYHRCPLWPWQPKPRCSHHLWQLEEVGQWLPVEANQLCSQFPGVSCVGFVPGSCRMFVEAVLDTWWVPTLCSPSLMWEVAPLCPSGVLQA